MSAPASDAGRPAAPLPRVAVVGAGAVGCYFGAMLAAARVPVVLIGRPAHVAALRSRGLRLTTDAGTRDIPVEASVEPAAAASARIVLVCVKSGDTEAVGEALAPHLAPGTAVYSLQNGVDNAQRLAHVMHAYVRPAVVYVASEMAGDGHVRHLGRGDLVLPEDAVPRTELPTALDNAQVAALFVSAGVPCTLARDVTASLWSKLVVNCAYNALSAITGLPYGALVQQPGIAQVMRDGVLECLAVASALGIVPAGDVFEAVDRIAGTMPGQFSSTAQDLKRGKPTEIAYLNGHVVREGERLGVATPVNRTLVALVRALEAGSPCA